MAAERVTCSGDELLVDGMIAAAQRPRRASALASAGRSLVPYFVPGSAEPSEGDINVNTDVDAHRRNGASILEAPVPIASFRDHATLRVGPNEPVVLHMSTRRFQSSTLSFDGIAGGQSGQRALKVPKTKKVVSKRGGGGGSPTSPFHATSFTCSDSDSADDAQALDGKAEVEVAMLASLTTSSGAAQVTLQSAGKVRTKSRQRSKAVSSQTPVSTDVLRSQEKLGSYALSVKENWAGPAFANSPPPSSLPMPRFTAIAKSPSPLPRVDAITAGQALLQLVSKPAATGSTLPLRRVLDLSQGSVGATCAASTCLDNPTAQLKRILNVA
eukprot:SM000084S23147  [mRNA]  locus=s84:543315:544741:+ [translate_table: standard]